MFEDLIVTLDDLGVAYTEDAEAGTLTIDIADVDKSVLVSIINALMNNGIADYSIDDSVITITGYAVATEDETYEEDYDAQAQALDEMSASMGGGSY